MISNQTKLLAPGCHLDDLTEVVDPGMDLPVHHVGNVVAQILDRLDVVLVKRRAFEGNSYVYELVPWQEAASRYFIYNKASGR